MTTPEALNALADRVERVEPHALLDAAIHAVVHGAMDLQDDQPAYTTSLDAAVTLVPEGWNWGVDGQSSKQFEATVWKAASRFLVCDDVERYGRHKVAAAALTAAALRARAAMERT